jgi:RNA polymerase sigma-70 factor (ECF subfamily)
MQVEATDSVRKAAEAEAAAVSRAQDAALLSAFKGGDNEAFGDLVRKYESRVLNHCLRMVGDEQDSRDLAQDVFMKVYRGVKNYEHTFAFYTWVYRITVNCCIDHLRRKKRHAPQFPLAQSTDPDSSEPAPDMAIADETYAPEKAALGNEMNVIIYSAIAKLSPKLQDIIVLKEIDGLSYEEIGALLGCSRGTVKSRLFRARERLKDLLGTYMDS